MLRLDERCDAVLRELDALRSRDSKAVTGFTIRKKQANDFCVEGGGFTALPALWGSEGKYWQLRAEIEGEAGEGPFCFAWDVDRVDGRARGVQALLFVDGRPVTGLDCNHTSCVVAERAEAGRRYRIDIVCYTDGATEPFSVPARTYYADERVQRLYYDIKVPADVARELTAENDRALAIWERLSAAIDFLDLRDPYSDAFYRGVDAALAYLSEEFYGKFCNDARAVEAAVGHTHIDVAWLWPLSVTKDKAVRSFATVLALMDRYPDYVFMSSQPLLYRFVKEAVPELYERIKRRVAEGRWEVEGGMYLEADCNLTGGESLVRQILYGKRFFKREFGRDTRVLWLPDVFGYSAALPQILKKSGIDYFMTTKINWNDTNKLPCDTFRWRGLDGSEVFSHCITTSKFYPVKNQREFYTTYNGDTDANSVLGCWQRYQHKELNDTVLNCYGYGDGGGGPTAQMLENIARYRGIPDCPVVKPMRVRDFFDDLSDRLSGSKRLSVWEGELYFEYHRGTLTTMAENKRYNRKAEIAVSEAELFHCMAERLGVSRGYPYAALEACWETILLNQFHDILPGSAIEEVYRESHEQYRALTTRLASLQDDALQAMAAEIALPEESVAVFNPLGLARSDYAFLDGGDAEVYDGDTLLPCQTTHDGRTVFFAADVPAKGYRTFCVKRRPRQLQAEGPFQSAYYDVAFAENGRIASLYDRQAGRQVLTEPGNRLRAYEDIPLQWDAWELRNYYREKFYEIDCLTELRLIESGPVRRVLRLAYRYHDSVIRQDIVISDLTRRIDFETEVDWHEEHTLLKAEFPVEVHALRATYDIQFGNVERSTHANTSWDEARFEVCGHKWADLSEGDYGVALLNDCKYGYGITGSVITLSLLRSPKHPNPTADRGHHRFTYSLLPHAKDYWRGGVMAEGYRLNYPLKSVPVAPNPAGKLAARYSLLSVAADNIVVDTVKRAEDGDGYILRLFETCNARTDTCCRLGFPLAEAEECDLLENPLGRATLKDGAICMHFAPFEIKTYRIRLPRE